MIHQIQNIKEVVRRILEQHPDTRDNDELLLLKVWSHQNPMLRDPSFPFMNFGIEFKKHNYANAESVRRVRQKLQEECPSLRGNQYYKRKGMAEEVRQYMRS